VLSYRFWSRSLNGWMIWHPAEIWTNSLKTLNIITLNIITKHINIKYNFIRENIKDDDINIKYIYIYIYIYLLIYYSIYIYAIIRSYLLYRTFTVKYEEVITQLKKINSGISQSSILRPILYLLYTADLPLSLGSITTMRRIQLY